MAASQGVVGTPWTRSCAVQAVYSFCGAVGNELTSCYLLAQQPVRERRPRTATSYVVALARVLYVPCARVDVCDLLAQQMGALSSSRLPPPQANLPGTQPHHHPRARRHALAATVAMAAAREQAIATAAMANARERAIAAHLQLGL